MAIPLSGPVRRRTLRTLTRVPGRTRPGTEALTNIPPDMQIPFWNQPRLRRSLVSVAMVGLSSIAMTACDDSSTEPGGAVVKLTIVQNKISQPKTNMLRGITIQLIAVPVNADSNFVNTPVTWTSSDATKATVDANGLVTTVAGGNVTISASAGGQTGTYDLNIQFPVGSITISPAAPTIRQEGAVTLTAALLGTDGIAATGRTVTWSSSNPAVATVNATTGFVAGISNGTATITATSEGVTGTRIVTVSGSALVATVTVTSPTGQTPFGAIGTTMQLTQTSRAASGNTVSGTTATWTSSSAAIATVSATGLVTFVSEGSATITANVDNGIGTNVAGQLSVQSAPQLVNGVATVIASVSSGAIRALAFVVPAGTTNLSIAGSGGGAGDPDVYVFAPSVTPSALNLATNALAYSNSTSFSANSGGAESISIASPAAGTWRVIVYAWSGAGAATNYSVTATRTP